MTELAVVDVHAHYLPPGWGGSDLPPALYDLDLQRAEMDRVGIAHRAVCPPPFALAYAGDDLGRDTRLNELLAAAVAKAPVGRFVALGTVPLHRPEAAAAELGRVMRQLDMRGVTIGSSVGPAELDDPRLDPFWSEAERSQALILLHPSAVPGAERMAGYHLRNLVGNPTATALAAARLIFGGVLDRHPGLQIVLSHGGGSLPWIVSRLDHGYRVRPECCLDCAQTPSAYLERFYFDTVVFTDSARQWLRTQVGGTRLLYGTDTPFDMGDATGAEAADHAEAARLLRLEE